MLLLRRPFSRLFSLFFSSKGKELFSLRVLLSLSLSLFLSQLSSPMGADCCGGGPPPASDASAVGAAAAAVDGLSVNQVSPSKVQKKADATASARPHSEYVADLQAFLAKRIELFEQYRKRDVDKVRWWRESWRKRKARGRKRPSLNRRRKAVGGSFPMASPLK